MRKIITLLAIVVTSTVLCACDDVQWFVKESRVSSVSDDELEKDKYYVKQNTRFWPICTETVGKNMTTTERISKSRVIPLIPKIEKSVPDCFYEEGLAYASDKEVNKRVVLERYKSIGMSIGVYNGVFDDSGYFYIEKNRDHLVPESSLETALSNTSSNYIRIISINNERITPAQVDEECGVINVLEGEKEYSVQLYAGTEYMDVKVIADTLMLKSFEMFEFDNEKGMDYSTNSYLYFAMPTDMKTGYYQINGSGVFKYYDCPRGQEDINADTTVAYYGSRKDQLISFSRQYSLNLPNKVRDMAIRIPFTCTTEDMIFDVSGFVYAPDDTEYEMSIETDKSKEFLSLNISEAMAGEWTINVTPKDLTIEDVQVTSSKIEEEASESVEEFVLEEAAENITFKVDTTGEGEIYGYLLSPDGRTYDMNYEYNKQENTGKLSYPLSYAKEGKWTVKVYYHPITNTISDIQMELNAELETDVIVIN